MIYQNRTGKSRGKLTKLPKIKTCSRRRKDRAFTLLELLITIVIIVIIAVIAVPEVMEAQKRTKAQACGAAIRTIEAAKVLVRRDHPGQPITIPLLEKYLPGGAIPKDPWKVGFQNIESHSETTHPYNNNCQYEPRNNCSPCNGFNDACPPQE